MIHLTGQFRWFKNWVEIFLFKSRYAIHFYQGISGHAASCNSYTATNEAISFFRTYLRCVCMLIFFE